MPEKVFETERLIVRGWDADADLEAAFRIYGDPEVTRFLNGVPDPDLEASAKRLHMLIERNAGLPEGNGFWALELKATGELIGAGAVKHLPDADRVLQPEVEVGWHLGRAHWGNGYATEFGRAGVRYGFEVLNQDVLYCILYRENLRSARVAERVGFRLLGETSRFFGVTADLYCLSREDWKP